MDIVRVGAFNLAFEAATCSTTRNTQRVSELQRQPEQGRFHEFGLDMTTATTATGHVRPIDVTRGGILALLVESPTIQDRINQGGIVGYCIIGLGIIGLLIAIVRFIGLSTASRKVAAQLKREHGQHRQPAGSCHGCLREQQGCRHRDDRAETQSKAALKEMPGLTKGLLFIKVISVVAPLMGLLGTVTGMIKTFQVITLYGAGDPKMMAGGISQALMTTVLGLVVAIPMVLLHTIVSGQSRKVINILQSQAAGLVAQHSEGR